MVVDLRKLLDGRTRGDEVEVHGVRRGDRAERLAAIRWTSADGDELPGEQRAYGEGRVYRVHGQERVEIPLAERVEGVLARRGWLREDGVALFIEHGRISRIALRGPSLDALGIRAPKDVERLLGPAEERVRHQRQVTFLYPTRGFEVAWDDAGRLDHVTLGQTVGAESRRGASALLAELIARWKPLEAQGWREPEEGALRVRHRRIAALARALELGTVEDVALGQAIARRGDAYLPLLAEIAARAPGLTARQFVPAQMVYSHLLHYRVGAEAVLGATRGWLECGDAALLGMITTQAAIAAVLRKELAPIDAWLAGFLDPLGRSFSERELIATWDWPDVDPSALEMEDELGPL